MDFAMPVLEPVPIETRGKPWYVRGRRWLFGRRKWRLRDDFYFIVLGVVVRIPAGFVTDFASIPRPLWPLLSPTGILMIPAILHDWYYQYNFFETDAVDGSRPFGIVFAGRGKRFADAVFRQVAHVVNGMVIPNGAAWVFLGVFGWPAWWSYRRRHRGV